MATVWKSTESEAQIKQQLRTAAQHGKWRTVEELIQQADVEAGDNAWLKASLASIKRYATARHEARMSQEARYSSKRMMTRMA